ncbi:MAG: protein phosphatase 2C domain-containing protein [archaeon]
MLKIIARQGFRSFGKRPYEDKKIVDTKNSIFIVADGMGGHPSPGKASRYAAEICHEDLIGKLSNAPDNKILERIESAIGYTNRALCALSDSMGDLKRENKRAGTTLDVCYFRNGILYGGHIGDGRVYQLRKIMFRKLTEDHTSLDYSLDEGEVKLNDRFGFGSIERYIGDTSDFNPQLYSSRLRQGDTVLMTTDGLTKMLFDLEIKKVLKETPFDSAARGLIKACQNPVRLINYLAKKRGIHTNEAKAELQPKDDVTVVLIKYKGEKNG